jgi:hypothetical protein
LNSLIQYVADNYHVTVDETDLVFGAIIGSVKMTDCVFGSHPSIWYGDDYGFELKDPFAYLKPIPCQGQLRLYERPELARKIANQELLRKGGKR